MMKKIKQGVEALVEQEYNLAYKDHGEKFHSAHEAYAVILEEAEEAGEDLSRVRTNLSNFWLFNCRKNDKLCEQKLHSLTKIKENAILAACEAIQVAAMAHKALKGFEKGE